MSHASPAKAVASPSRSLWAGLGAVVLRILVAAVATLAVVALLSLVAKVSPAKAIPALLSGAFGSRFAWYETVIRSIPICLTGLAVAWAFRAGLFNIGAEGQLLWGALAAAWVGAAVKLPMLLHLPLALLAAALAGALWAAPAALLKVRRGTPEVVTTLLLNFIAVNLTRFVANNPLHDPTQQDARTVPVHSTAVLPVLSERLHAGLILALLAVVLLAAVLARGRFGFQLRVVGQNPEAARTADLSVQRIWTSVLLQSGALAGLAGAVEVLGIHHYFLSGFSPGYGFEGISVAILGASHPLGVAVSALFWGGLANGAVELELSTNLSRHLVTVIQAMVVLVVAVRRWPIRVARRSGKAHAPSAA